MIWEGGRQAMSGGEGGEAASESREAAVGGVEEVGLAGESGWTEESGTEEEEGWAVCGGGDEGGEESAVRE